MHNLSLMKSLFTNVQDTHTQYCLSKHWKWIMDATVQKKKYLLYAKHVEQLRTVDVCVDDEVWFTFTIWANSFHWFLSSFFFIRFFSVDSGIKIECTNLFLLNSYRIEFRQKLNANILHSKSTPYFNHIAFAINSYAMRGQFVNIGHWIMPFVVRYWTHSFLSIYFGSSSD